MASRKLTQLPTATEVTTSDKIYIVDVSDTTESPQGTSKQALISELPSSGITTLTSTDGSIGIDLTDPSEPDLSANQITSLNTGGDTFIEFRSEAGITLYAKTINADFNNPFTILNDEGVVKIGFFDKSTPAAQAAAIADATDATDVITQLNTLLAAMRAYGLIAE